MPYAVENAKQILGKKPVFGICMGHQVRPVARACALARVLCAKREARGCPRPPTTLLTRRCQRCPLRLPPLQVLGQAFGATTFKLKFGHHGGNHPIRHGPSGARGRATTPRTRWDARARARNVAVDLPSRAPSLLAPENALTRRPPARPPPCAPSQAASRSARRTTTLLLTPPPCPRVWRCARECTPVRACQPVPHPHPTPACPSRTRAPQVSHINLNDGTCAGLVCSPKKAMTIQVSRDSQWARHSRVWEGGQARGA